MDPYQILGIKQGSDKETIRKAYLSKAMEWHPDKNKDKDATAKFREINEAYEVLSTTDGIDSILNNLFGFINHKTKITGNILIDINVTLENLYCGTECVIEYDKQIIDESVVNNFCKECGGYGYKTIVHQTNSLSFVNDSLKCEVCLGCGFSGKLIKIVQEMSIVVPPKTANDDKLVFKSLGNQKLDGTFGDLVVQLVNYKHRVYTRENDDLHMIATISFRESLLGFERKIKRLDDSSFSFKVKGPVKIGKVVILQGYGMTINTNMVITIEFQMPKKLTPEQQLAIETTF
jgi:DnaJ-class molecular chaperone